MKTLAELAEGPWSKSSLSKLLDDCAWQWALDKLHGHRGPGTPHTAVGTAMHAVIEAHERQRIVARRLPGHGNPDGLDRGEAESMVEVVALSELVQVPGQVLAAHDMKAADVVEWAGWLLANWWDADCGDGGSLRARLMRMIPVAAEPYFRAGGQHGYLDELLFDPADWEWVVVDHKSAGNFSYWKPDGKGKELEAATYVVGAELAESLPAQGPIRMEWHVVRREDPTGRTSRWQGARLVTRHLTEEDRALRLASVDAARDRVLAGDFPTNPSWNLCSPKWCHAYDGCQVTGLLSPSMLPTPG